MKLPACFFRFGKGRPCPAFFCPTSGAASEPDHRPARPLRVFNGIKWVCLPLVTATIVLGLGTGCQSVSTANSPSTKSAVSASKTSTASRALVANPRPVVVRDFTFDVAQLHTDPGLLPGRHGPVKRVLGDLRSEENPIQKAKRFAQLLSQTITEELSEMKIPSHHESPGMPWPADGLVVSGEFLEVDEGNRLKRAVIGFGSGATEVLVQVAIFDLVQSREQPILVYGAGTGSKPMPGAIVTLNPYAMAAKYVLARNATEKEVRKLGKQIARDLSQIEAGGVSKR